MDSTPQAPADAARRRAELTARFPGLVATDADTLQAYGTDWTRVHRPDPLAVARPRSTADVVALVGFCQDNDLAVVPSGGRTGLSGGAVAAHGELVLSLERMRRMDPVQASTRTVRVQAGAVTHDVHQHCAAAGLTWPVDFASSGSSQVGGNIATNAGGVHVVRYGSTRAWVMGLEVVTMTGDVLQLGGALEKDNTGLDLKDLVVGSEGTLAIITEATLKLAPLVAARAVAFLAVDHMAAALDLLASLRNRPADNLHAFEYLDAHSLEVVLERRSLAAPLAGRAPGYVLVEVAAPEAAGARRILEDWLAEPAVLEQVSDGVISQSASQASTLWQLREGISEALAHDHMIHKDDVAVPVADVAAFHQALTALMAAEFPRMELSVFGHVGDGNLHVNMRKPADMTPEEFRDQCHAVDQAVWALVLRYRGSLSAEHGIGLLKKAALPLSRSPREIGIYRAIKRAFDPKGLLNPGKVFAPDAPSPPAAPEVSP